MNQRHLPPLVNQFLSNSNMLSVYIPVVLASMTTEDFVREVFKINKIGTVSHVDFVFNGTKYSAYVHFSEWESNSTADVFRCQLEEEIAYRLYFDYPADYEYKTGYWICLKNKSAKTNHQTPKVRIDVSGLQDVEDVYEEEEEMEEEEEEEEEIEEEEDKDAWMDDLMENDADTESEAWDFMMEELAKEDAEKAEATANYVRTLEEEVAYLQHMLKINAENAYYAQNAWNHERTHLINTARHFETAANELYLTNRSLSGFLQNPAHL